MIVLYRRRILRAVAGDLTPGQEVRLRDHLRGCAPCRDLYDRLMLVSSASSAAATGTTRLAAAREQARLFAALDAPAAAPPAPSLAVAAAPARRRWWPILTLAPALAALAWFVWPVRAPSPEVTWRGAPTEPAAAAGALIVYGSRRGADAAPGPVRVVAEFPGSGEGRVSIADYVQFGVRGLRAPAFVTVAGVDDGGEAHIYLPRPGVPPRPIGGGGPAAPVGPSIDLGRGHHPGRLRVYALFSAQPLAEADVRAALLRVGHQRAGVAPLDLPVPQVAGLLIVEP